MCWKAKTVNGIAVPVCGCVALCMLHFFTAAICLRSHPSKSQTFTTLDLDNSINNFALAVCGNVDFIFLGNWRRGYTLQYYYYYYWGITTTHQPPPPSTNGKMKVGRVLNIFWSRIWLIPERCRLKKRANEQAIECEIKSLRWREQRGAKWLSNIYFAPTRIAVCTQCVFVSEFQHHYA